MRRTTVARRVRAVTLRGRLCVTPKGRYVETFGRLPRAIKDGDGGCRPLRALVCLRVVKKRLLTGRSRD